MIRCGWIVAAACAALLLASCSSEADEKPNPGSSVFAGLDPIAVEDVLASAQANQNVAILAPEDRDSMWQGMVGNFVMCRQMLQVYQAWRETGFAPDPLPSPTAPQQPEASYADLESAYDFYQGLVNSGDISALREALTNASGCGDWVPAEEGASGGQTVAEAVLMALATCRARPPGASGGQTVAEAVLATG